MTYDANAGDSVHPPFSDRAERSVVSASAVRVIDTVYVLGAPDPGVITTVIVFAPLLRVIAPDALPLATAAEFTVIDPWVDDCRVGVTVTLVIVYGSVGDVYVVVPGAKTGLIAVLLTTRFDRLLLVSRHVPVVPVPVYPPMHVHENPPPLPMSLHDA